MNSQWIASVPIIIFSIIAGALSDEFGRVKPLILIPLIGNILSGLVSMVSCALIDVVPLEFFYLENIGAFFGSYAGTNSIKSNPLVNSCREHNMYSRNRL